MNNINTMKLETLNYKRRFENSTFSKNDKYRVEVINTRPRISNIGSL